VIGAATYEEIRELATAAPLGDIQVKGKAEAVGAYVLLLLG